MPGASSRPRRILGSSQDSASADDEEPDPDPGEQWLIYCAHPMPPVPEVDYDPDDTGYIGTLLGPDGSDLLDVYEPRPPFGFHGTLDD